MLFKLGATDGKFDSLEPLAFKTFGDYGQVEKDLENLLSNNMLEMLFLGSQLMPIHQERARQEEGDIYALNRDGDLVIFELKRAVAGGDAVHQALRYCEQASRWQFSDLERKYQKFPGSSDQSLQGAHRMVFDLDTPLSRGAFNQKQHLMVVGSAGNESLVQSVNHWRSMGISIDFVPYRIFDIGGEPYFEFFSPPFDQHPNPTHRKGVLFDTNRTYVPDGMRYMLENSRVAAFGGANHLVDYLGSGDYVFLWQAGAGIVGAGRVKGNVKEDLGFEEARFRDLELLWRVNWADESSEACSAGFVRDVLGKNFFWARTMKTPYLSVAESEVLLTAILKRVSP